MKKIQLVGLVLVAVFAISAMVASSAFAESEWLLNAEPITSAIATEAPGTLKLEDSATGTGKITCVGNFVGTVGPGSADTISTVLGKTSTEVAPINCESVSCASKLAELSPINLPWSTKVELSGTLEWDHFLGTDSGAKEPGYSLKCTVLGIPITDVCTGLAGAALSNVTGGVQGIFTPGEEPINPSGTCTFSKEKSATIEGGGVTKPTLSGTLTVS
jgi:hypothetical protein